MDEPLTIRDGVGRCDTLRLFNVPAAISTWHFVGACWHVAQFIGFTSSEATCDNASPLLEPKEGGYQERRSD